MTFASSGHPGVGPTFANTEFVVYNRTGSAVTVGDVLMLDHLAVDPASYTAASYNSDAATKNSRYAALTLNVDGGTGGSNAATWPLGNALTPIATGIGAISGSAAAGSGASGGAPLVVVTDLLSGAGANDTKVRVCIRGLVEVNTAASAAVVFGDGLFAAAAVTLTPTLTVGVRVVAKALSGRDNAATIQKVLCYFDGSNLFGKQFAG